MTTKLRESDDDVLALILILILSQGDLKKERVPVAAFEKYGLM